MAAQGVIAQAANGKDEEVIPPTYTDRELGQLLNDVEEGASRGAQPPTSQRLGGETPSLRPHSGRPPNFPRARRRCAERVQQFFSTLALPPALRAARRARRAAH